LFHGCAFTHIRGWLVVRRLERTTATPQNAERRFKEDTIVTTTTATSTSRTRGTSF